MPTEISEDAIIRRIVELSQEHKDLDHAINLLVGSALHDQIQLQRMKKRKLLLKDQIAYLQVQLDPDVSA